MNENSVNKIETAVQKSKICTAEFKKSINTGICLDFSKSTEDFYNSGIIQDILDIIVENTGGNTNVWLFNEKVYRLKDINTRNYEDYIEREVLKQENFEFRGTKYTPILKEVTQNINGIKFIIFVTDGKPWDSSQAVKVIKESSKNNTFILFISLNNKSNILNKLKDQIRDEHSNIELLECNMIYNKESYIKVLESFNSWLMSRN